MCEAFGLEILNSKFSQKMEECIVDQGKVGSFLRDVGIILDETLRPPRKPGFTLTFESPSKLGSMLPSGSKIGAHSFVGKSCGFNNTPIEIGRFCSIASDITFGPAEHPVSHFATSNVFYARNPPTGNGAVYKKFAEKSRKTLDDARNRKHQALDKNFVTLGNDVWVGMNVIVRKGVTINTGAVVGSCAFVSKDVEPYAIMGGVPARLIRPRFDESVINSLMKTQWWNLELETMVDYPFHDPAEIARRLEQRTKSSSDVARYDKVVIVCLEDGKYKIQKQAR
jgi:acetyltransferase-like isoleucine patch superfamily enzyme